MADYPTASTPIQVRGLREVCEVNGRRFSRLRGTQQWIEAAPRTGSPPSAPSTPSAGLYLSLVHQQQGEGEPYHWSLFVAEEGEPGWIYQVKGDAEFMRHEHSPRQINIINSASFLNIYNLTTITEQQATVVREIATSEAPPRAPNRQSVTENCQGWTVRVIGKLVARGIVPAGKLDMAKTMMQPV